MNIFEYLKKYKKDKKQTVSTDDLDEKGRDNNGVYRNEYMSRKYSDLCKDAAELTEDAFEGSD
jgi:hypothetical protein